VTKRFSHPLLGEFVCEHWEWRLQHEIEFPCAGYSTSLISISADPTRHEPAQEQLQALVELMQAPAEFRHEIAKAIFGAYMSKIRPVYLEVLSASSDPIADYGVAVSDLPEVDNAEDVWRFITALRYIWVNEDASVIVEYTVTFDDEHEIHVLLKSMGIERVWME
jgi:hypothetical protein